MFIHLYSFCTALPKSNKYWSSSNRGDKSGAICPHWLSHKPLSRGNKLRNFYNWLFVGYPIHEMESILIFRIVIICGHLPLMVSSLHCDSKWFIFSNWMLKGCSGQCPGCQNSHGCYTNIVTIYKWQQCCCDMGAGCLLQTSVTFSVVTKSDQNTIIPATRSFVVTIPISSLLTTAPV